MSVIVRTDVTFQEGVPHTRQDVQRQGWTIVGLEEGAYSGRINVGSQTYFVEVLCRGAVLDRKPGSGLPLVGCGCRCLSGSRRIYQRLNYDAGPQASQRRIIFAHVS